MAELVRAGKLIAALHRATGRVIYLAPEVLVRTRADEWTAIRPAKT